MNNVVKFPVNVSRRAHAPEERAERTRQPGHDWNPDHKGNNPLRAPFTAVSRAVTLVGKVIYRRHGFDPDELCESIRSKWVADLRDGENKARRIAKKVREGGRAHDHHRLSERKSSPRRTPPSCRISLPPRGLRWTKPAEAPVPQP